MSAIQDIFDAILGAKKGSGHTVVVMHPTEQPTASPTPTDSLGLKKTLGGSSKAGSEAYAALEDNDK